MSIPGGGEWIIVLLVILLLFGAKKLPELARSMGQAGKELKQGFREGHTEAEIEGPCPFCEAEVGPDAKFCPGCGKSADEVVAERAKKSA